MKQVIEPIPGSKMNRFWRFFLGKVIPADGIITSCDLKSKEIKWLWSKIGDIFFWLLIIVEFFYICVIKNVLDSRYTFLTAVALFLLFAVFYDHKITVRFRKVVSKIFEPGFEVGGYIVPWAVVVIFAMCIGISIVYVRDALAAKTLFLPSIGIGLPMIIFVGSVSLFFLLYGFYRIAKEVIDATIGQQELIYVAIDGKMSPLLIPKYMAWAIKLKLCKVYDFKK